MQSLAHLEQFSRPGDIDILCSTDSDCLQPLVSHNDANPTGCTGVIMIDGCHIDPVLTGQADGRHLHFLIVQFSFYQVSGFRSGLSP